MNHPLLPATGKNVANAVCSGATAAAGNFLSAGDAAAVSVSARRACRKIFGACPAMGLPGSARIAGIKTGSETSRNGPGPKAQDARRYEKGFWEAGFIMMIAFRRQTTACRCQRAGGG